MAGATEALVVFARRPVPGEVKTRLARAIGAEAAARLYRAFVADLARRFGAGPPPAFWAVAPPLGDFAELFGLPRERCFEQSGGDLGARLRAAFRAMRERGFSRVAAIGSDSPHLPARRMREALARLERADVVLGPARDGGYYLVALRGPADVFSGIAWSTPDVLSQTLARVASLGLRADLLEPDFDVDTASDLDRLRAQVASAPEDLPATAAALARLGQNSMPRSGSSSR